MSHKLNFLVWVVALPLLILFYKKPLKRVILLGLTSSIISVAVSFTWLINYSWSVYFLSSLIFASFLFLFAVVFNILSKSISGYLQIFVAPFVYSMLMIAYSFSPINSYWADWSIFQPMVAPVVWFIGGSGVTFLIILSNSIAAFYLLKGDKKILLTGAIVISALSISYLYSYNAEPKGQNVKVALLQGNINYDWDWRRANAKGLIFDIYESMSIEASKLIPDMIVWPEYAIADDILNDKDLMGRISNLAKLTSSYLVIGTLRWHDSFYESERERNDIALVFSPSGELIGEYNSLVPLPFDKPVLPGGEIRIFNTGIAKFGVFLCYEETQGKISRTFSAKGSQFLISLANNLILDNTTGLYLTSLFTNLRAVENGKYLIRVTNTGITKIVNPYGKVLEELKPYTRGVLVGNVYLNNKNTFYTEYGNLILYITLFSLTILFGINNGFSKRKFYSLNFL